MSSGEKYVAAAYGVVFVAVLVYVAIIAAKLARLERETGELAELARRDARAAMAELLVWPGAARLRRGRVRLRGRAARPRARRPARDLGRPARLARADRRCSSAQALAPTGFPWGTWAGALNLFVWLVVGAYLIWGCTPRYRLLGLAVMPVAAALLALAWAGGGTGARRGRALAASCSPSTPA